MGSHDGQVISNTAVLDNQFHWKGLCVDIYPTNMEKRTCTIIKEVIYDKSGKKIQFKVANALGGITTHMKKHKHATKNSKEVTYITKSAHDILKTNNVPSVVDFLDMDVEGAELKFLEGMENDHVFDHYCFKNIAVEHNFIEPERSNIRTLLQRNQYVYKGSEKFDDYYSKSCGVAYVPNSIT